MDSGNFLFDEDHVRIFTNALALIKLGADKKLIVDNILRSKSINTMKFVQILLERMKIKNDILSTYYTDKELTRYHIDQEEA